MVNFPKNIEVYTIVNSTYLYYKYHLHLHKFSSTFTMSKLILGICFFFLSCTTAQYEFFILSEQWSFSLCKNQRTRLCVKLEEKTFRIHGLWPANYTGTQPAFCTKRNPIPPVLTNNDVRRFGNNINTSWPNYLGDNFNFWYREWRKHGSCSYPQYSPTQYFALALNAYGRHNLYQILMNAKISPHPTNLQDSAKFITEIGSSIRVTPKITCIGNNPPELMEIGLCMDKSGRFISCLRNNIGCGQQFLWYAP
jgi:ribonuclease T2